MVLRLVGGIGDVEDGGAVDCDDGEEMGEDEVGWLLEAWMKEEDQKEPSEGRSRVWLIIYGTAD